MALKRGKHVELGGKKCSRGRLIQEGSIWNPELAPTICFWCLREELCAHTLLARTDRAPVREKEQSLKAAENRQKSSSFHPSCQASSSVSKLVQNWPPSTVKKNETRKASLLLFLFSEISEKSAKSTQETRREQSSSTASHCIFQKRSEMGGDAGDHLKSPRALQQSSCEHPYLAALAGCAPDK